MFSVRMLLKLLIIMVFLNSAQAQASAAKIEKVGMGSVIKVSRAGAVLKLKEGDALESGDELTTDANTAVDLRLDDETLIRIGVNSSYKVQEDSKFHFLIHHLLSGVVRVLVKPSDHDKKEAAAVKFRLNTPEGTIGVRGTEFVVVTAKGKTEVNGLDGEVIFGPADADFAKTADFVSVSRGFHSYILANAKAANKPDKFDLKNYIDRLSEKHGVFGPLAGRVSGANKYVRKNPTPSATSPMSTPAAAVKAALREEPKEKKKAKETTKVDYQHMLLVAAQDGDTAKAEKALKGGAQIDGKGSSGHTALQVAMVFKKKDMFVFLIKRGANVEAKNEDGLTPLMFVATHNLDLDFAKALVYPGGADFMAKDPKTDLTVTDMAKASKYQDLVDYLDSKEAENDLDKALTEKEAAKKK